MPTIKDVAQRAGVSVTTVSRVLNASGYFDEETARAVHHAVEALGYRPNVNWTRLKRRTSQTIAFLLGNRDAMNSMQMSVLMACERALKEAGYDLVFSSFRYCEHDRPAQIQLPRFLAQDGMVDGAILAGVQHGNLLRVFQRLKLPYVLLGTNFVGKGSDVEHNTVTYDDVAGVYEAASHLIRLGHRRVAFIGNIERPWFQRRHEGYRRALAEANLAASGVTEPWQVSNAEYGELATEALLRQGQAPTAILAGNDELAAGAWKALTKRRVRIPQEVSLAGFGDRAEFSILEPPLTSVSVFPEKLGAALARMMLDRLGRSGGDVKSQVFPCKFMERNSCAPPASRVTAVARN